MERLNLEERKSVRGRCAGIPTDLFLTLDEKGMKLAQILQEINTNRKKNGQDVVKLTKNLLNSIILHMNNFEQTLKEFRSVEKEFKSVEKEFKSRIDHNRKTYYKIFKGENLANMNVKELLDITRPRKQTRNFNYYDNCKYHNNCITKHYELVGRFWDQFSDIAETMWDNFYINSDDDVFREIFKVRFNENYDGSYRSTYYNDFLTQKTLYDIAQAGENDEVFGVELEIVKGKNGWPKFQIPFDWLDFVDGSMCKGEKRTVIIATNIDRYPIFRLRINKSELIKEGQKNGRGDRVEFYNGKVYLTGDKVKRSIDLTNCLY